MTNKRLHLGCGLIAGHGHILCGLGLLRTKFQSKQGVTVRDTMFWSHEEYLWGDGATI